MTMFCPKPRARVIHPTEPSFADAQRWWTMMRKPATFMGVPGYPYQSAALWNASVLFWPRPQEFTERGARFGGPSAMMRDLAGHETQALQIEFSFGARFHFPDRRDISSREYARSLEDGCLPVVCYRLKHAGLEWTCTVFARLARGVEGRTGSEPLLTEILWTVRNPGSRRAAAQLACHINTPHVAFGYKVALLKRAPQFARMLKWKKPFLVDDLDTARLAAEAQGIGKISYHQRLPAGDLAKAELSLESTGLDHALLFEAGLAAGGRASLRLTVPFFSMKPDDLRKALETSFSAGLAATRRYWRRELEAAGGIRTADRAVNNSFNAWLVQTMLAVGRRPGTRQWILKTSPNHYEGLWAAMSAVAANGLDLYGKHEWSRRVLETLLEHQGPVPDSMVKMWGDENAGESEGLNSHPGFLGNIDGRMAILWAISHGWTMWAVCRHASLTGDWNWLRRQTGRLALACEWIAAQRRRTMRRDRKGRKSPAWGLLPAMNAFDWGFGHVVWSDAFTWMGLNEAASCLARMGHSKACRFRAETEAYRRDIIRAIERARDRAERVPTGAGRSIPFVPSCIEQKDYYEPDWTYVIAGPLSLGLAGVVPPHHELIRQTLEFLRAGRPLGKWIKVARLQAMFGTRKRQGWDWRARTEADRDFMETSRPRRGRAFFWRHGMTYEPGWIPQAFIFMEQDDMHDLLECFYSLVGNGSQHMEFLSPIESRDGVPWTQSGAALLTRLTREMLIRESGKDLILAGSCPRAWLAPGERLEVRSLPSSFGKVSYSLSVSNSGSRVRGSFDLRFKVRPARILLRLRFKGGALPTAAMADGKRVPVRGEWIQIPVSCRTLVVSCGRASARAGGAE